MIKRSAGLLLFLMMVGFSSSGQSSESTLTFDPLYPFNTRIQYTLYQTTDIQFSGSSFEIMRYKLQDGNGVTNDSDGLLTTVSSITFAITTNSIPGSSAIRKIALYTNGGTEIAELTYLGTPTVTFSGLNLFAPDDFSTALSIRVSFNNTSPAVGDMDLIQFKVTGITQSAGSIFNPAGSITGGDLSGGIVSGGTVTPADKNIINVIATKLDFITQPTPFAGINEPVTSGIVAARDQFDILDKEFNHVATVNAPALTIGAFTFSNGLLDLATLQYATPGDGTLSVEAPGGISSNMNDFVNGMPNVSIPSTHVDVIHVTTSVSTDGLSPSTNLLAGSQNRPIYGVTFSAPYTVPGQPLLNRFTISFSNSITSVFTNIKVFESSVPTFSLGTAVDITAIGGTLSVGPLSVVVDFPVPRDLSIYPPNQLTYFLVVDVNANVDGFTVPIMALVQDGGFGSSTNNNIITSKGSSTSFSAGYTYSFVSISPPILRSTYPAHGQRNVSQNQPTLELNFGIPVYTLDGAAKLYDGTDNSFVANLAAANGQFNFGSGVNNFAYPLIFNLPPLLVDHYYYITIAPGDFQAQTGIMDVNFNLFPGITAPYQVFFKTASVNAPKLLGPATTPASNNAVLTNVSTTGATINATFDLEGTAYYLVLPHLAAPPTNAQIKGAIPYPSALARGSFAINQTNPISQSGVITPFTSFSTLTTYDLWVYAESYVENSHILTPISAAAPYGSAPTYIIGGAGPTLSFVVNGIQPPGIMLNEPAISICSDAYQILNAPIIISEGLSSNFFGAGVQTINLVLPSGFQFDVSTTAGVANYGTLTLAGSDFVLGSGALYFLSSNILRIQYANLSSASSDNIIITGLRVKGQPSATGNIFRMGGSGLSAAIPDGTTVATISTYEPAPIPFTNSYSIQNFGGDPAVTSIPDDFGLLQFFPLGPPDPGSYIFSGPGVSGSIMNTPTSQLGVPFYVTLTHLDFNGCTSTNPVQYTIFDHTTGITPLNVPPVLTGSFPLAGALNVNPNQSTLTLNFNVPVWTLDGVVELYEGATPPLLIASLPAINGQYSGGNIGNLSNTLTFNIPPALLPDHPYFIKIAPGKFLGAGSPANTGIMDQAGNLYGGINSAGTLLFKTSSLQPPKLLGPALSPLATAPFVNNVSSTNATINGTFDQRGTAFYLIVNHGFPPPSNAQIKGNAVYLPFVVRGSFAISQVSPVSQFGTAVPAVPFSMGEYDVWICSENDADVPVSTINPYGAGPLFIEGGAGPTLTFVVPNPGPGVGVQLNHPNISICANSFQGLNAPIIFSESALNSFSGPGVQTVNLSLPSGFQFDISLTSGKPTYGKLDLNGADFVAGSGVIDFVDNTILRIRFEVASNASLDNIVISGLRVKAAPGVSGVMFRLGGNGLPSIADGTAIASLSSQVVAPVPFSNSYSEQMLVSPPIVPVTSIPDNFNPPNFSVQLIPQPGPGDFGVSTFSGLGVVGDQFHLTGVPKELPIDITMTHIDNNGCVSKNTIKHIVYDHTAAIGGLSVAYCPVNLNLPNPAPTGVMVHPVPYNNLPGYFMESLTAAVTNPSQIMFGPAWMSLIEQSLLVQGPQQIIGGNTYNSYSFDEAVILNAHSLSGGVIQEPYDNFLALTPGGKSFHTSGSLGVVEFTANFRAVSNPSLLIPRVQRVEFFLPAIPLVEVSLSNSTFTDLADPLNPGGTGTPIFCELGGLIMIKGYPTAQPGISPGVFSLHDAQTGVILTPPIPGTFIDNGNGTATIDPTLFTNAFHDIKIVYTYQENAAPCASMASKIIRVAPAPEASFNILNTIGPSAPTPASFCKDSQIEFISSSTVIPGSSLVIYDWNFGDVGSVNNVSTGITNAHVFGLAQNYTVSHKVTSNWGCTSQVTERIISIGGIPEVKFKSKGISAGDIFYFNGNDDPMDLPSGNTIIPSSHPESFDSFTWDFGEGPTPGAVVTGKPDALFPTFSVGHSYVNPGVYNVRLTVRSAGGCEGTLARPVYVSVRKDMASFIPSSVPYFEQFESTAGDWSAFGTNSSWEWGSPGAGKTIITPELSGLGLLTKMWVTNKSGKYQPNEKSYLYSPAFWIFDQPANGMFISFNKSQNFMASDGLVLQYSSDDLNILDPAKNWQTVGDNQSGSLWYNGSALASNPGNQISGSFGWTATQKWDRSAYKLDPAIFSTTSNVNPTKLVFRFALGSVNASVNADGVVLDNIRLGYDAALPTITPTQTITSLSSSQNDIVKFSLGDDVALKKVVFSYKNIGAAWKTVDFSQNQNGTPAGISASGSTVKNITSKEISVTFDHNAYNAFGIKYYLTVGDFINTISTDTTTLVFKYADAATSPPIPNLKFGGAPADWRMFSIPHILNDNTIQTLFSQMGPPGETTWRLLSWDNPSSNFIGYHENGNMSTIDRGRGYWFNAISELSRDLKIGLGAAPPADPNNLFVMKLKKGWNQIGNPYPVRMNWTEVLSFNHNPNVESLKGYTGGQQLVATTSLEQFEGAYVFAAQDIDLRIPVSSSPGGRIKESNERGWQLDFSLQKNDLINTIGGIGMMEKASDERDQHDQMRVPRFSTYLDATFHHAQYFYPYFSKDVVPIADSHIWKFEVESNDKAGISTITWDELQLAGASGELYLYDSKNEMVVDMRKTQHYSFELDGRASFKVYYGSAEFMEKNLSPEKLLMGNNYPNPFRSITTIPLALPGPGEEYNVKLSIYDLTGKPLAEVVNKTMASGFYEIQLDRNSIATPIAPGMYLYQVKVQSGDFYSVVTKKMIIE